MVSISTTLTLHYRNHQYSLFVKYYEKLKYDFYLLVKKLTVLILALLYIVTTSGVTINMHYCMGEFVQMNFSHNKDNNCSNCGMKETESKGCCENEQKILKIDKEQKVTIAAQLPIATYYVLILTFFEITYGHFTALVKEHTHITALLRGRNLPLFIINCVLRI